MVMTEKKTYFLVDMRGLSDVSDASKDMADKIEAESIEEARKKALELRDWKIIKGSKL